MYKRILYLIFFLSILICILLKNEITFNRSFYLAELLSYVLCVLIFFKEKNKKNYFDFDTLFIAVVTIIHYITPFFVDSEILNMLSIAEFKTSYVLKSVLIVNIAMESYFIGSLYKPLAIFKVFNINYGVTKKQCPSSLFLYITIFFAIIFTLNNGFEYYKGMYNADAIEKEITGLAGQAMHLVVIFSNIYCATIFYKDTLFKKINIFGLSAVGIFALNLAFVGNRTFASYILLPYIMSYFAYKKNLSFVKFLLSFLFAVLSMKIIQIFRTGMFSLGGIELLSIFNDLTGTSAVMVNSIEYVGKFGHTGFSTFIPPLLGCIPGSGRIFGTLLGSAEVLTEYILSGTQLDLGLGTTIVADLYLSMGMFGVIFFMFVLGNCVKSINTNRILGIIVMNAFFSVSVFICRSSYLLPLRFVLWGSLMFILINSIRIKSYKKK